MKVTIINNLMNGHKTPFTNVSKIIEHELSIEIIDCDESFEFPKRFCKFIIEV